MIAEVIAGFAGGFATALVIVIVGIIWLKRRGYLYMEVRPSRTDDMKVIALGGQLDQVESRLAELETALDPYLHKK